MRSFAVIVSIFALAAIKESLAFCPAKYQNVRLWSHSPFMAADESISSTVDPFETYIPGEQTELVSKDFVVGTGESAKAGDVLNVEYKGQLMDASQKVFDEGTFSFKLGEGKVIPGWDKGLIGMQVGGKRTLKIPPNFAYGDRGAGDVIPAKADLQFEVELLDLGDGPVAEAQMMVTNISNRIMNPKGIALIALLIASNFIPKDLTLKDLFSL